MTASRHGLRPRRRISSGRPKDETKRPRYWSGWVQPGLTVDELARHRRRRPPPSDHPKDGIRTLEGTFAHLKTEYRRCYRRYSLTYLKSLEKLRPVDLLRLEGELFHSPEYQEEYKQYPYCKVTPQRRPTTLKPEGDLSSISETKENYSFKSAERSLCARRPTILKLDGDHLVTLSEVHEKFIEFPGVKRPNLTRKSTSLKLEGEQESVSEAAEKFVCHPPQERIEKIKPAENLVLIASTEEMHSGISETSQQFIDPGPQNRPPLTLPHTDLTSEGEREFHPEYNEKFIDHGLQVRRDLIAPKSELSPEGQREFHPEYKEQFVAFTAQRPLKVKKPENNLRPEGSIETMTEIKAEYIDFPRTRPVVPRKNPQLKLEGEMEKTTEIQSEFVDFHPQRPVLHRKNTILKPQGAMEKQTENSEEFRDFHPSRPVLCRPASNLKPSIGVIAKTTEKSAEFKDFHPQRPIIHRTPTTLKPEGQMQQLTEKKFEFKDFHPSRPVLHRKSSTLRPEGEMERTTEKAREYRDFHPTRPVMKRIPDHLKLEGQLLEKTSELHSEYRDFHPSRPVIHRQAATLRPGGEGRMEHLSELKSQYRENNNVRRPVIFTEGTNLKAGHRIEERKRALSAKKPDYISSSGSETLPRTRTRRNLLTAQRYDDTSTTTATSTDSLAYYGERPSFYDDHSEQLLSGKDKSFVVLQDDNNNDYHEIGSTRGVRQRSAEQEQSNRWLRGSSRDRAEPWQPSWALNPNTKQVPTA